VPNYQDVTINGTLTGNSFDHYKHGVLAFRVAGALSGAGVISMDSRGFQGDGSPANITGYGRGGNPTYPMKGNGGGAGHATNGKDGGSQEKDGDGGSTYGNPQLNSIFFGSGGGQSYTTTADVEYPGGGYGGGILFIMGQSINFQGNLSVKGQDRPTTIDCGLKGGAGSGGSIRVEGHDVTLNSINVQGGSPYDTYGYGGLGRVAVYYENSFSGNFTPGYLQKLDQPDTIFNSDFESGDLNQWTSAATDNGDLSASDSADYWGRYGLRALIDDTNALYVSDDSPASETRYRTRFYVDPNSLSMGAGEILDLLAGYNGATQVLRVQMQKVSGTYQLRAGLLSDAGSWTDTSWYAIQDAWTAVEIDWQALAYDGSLSLYVGGAFKQSLTRIDNDTRKLGSVRLGAMGVDAGTSGALYFDDFESRRYSYIGLLLDPGVDTGSPSESSSLLDGLISWWSLDETSGVRADSHGSNDLADYNTVGSTIGKQNNAASFVAADIEYLGIADNADLSLNGTSFTVAAWVNLSSKSSHRDIVLKGYTSSNDYEYALIYNQTVDRFGFYVSPDGVTSYNVIANNSDAPSTNTWYFVVAWYDGSSLNISVNNSSLDSISYSAGVYKGSQPFRLGYRGGYTYYLDGSLDEAFLYKRALTADERTWLYNGGQGRAYSDLVAQTEGWIEADFAYDGAQPHAVTEVTRASSTDTYVYDENGNMTCRVESGEWFEQSYNAENRISAITKRDGSCEGTLIASWSYAYDGDGTRVTTLYDDGSTQTLTRYYFGGAYEETGGAVRKYYSLAGQTVAMRDAEGLKYFLTDHLGSTLAVLDANGNVLSEQRYPSTGSGQVCLSAPCAMTWARSRRPTLATPPRETCPRPA
jgi:hypothetical protein